MEVTVVTDELLAEIEASTPDEQLSWLFLAESDEYKGYWTVEGLDYAYMFDFIDIIGEFLLVSPATVQDFLNTAGEMGYRVAFMDDPSQILDAYKYLSTVPDVSLHSSLDNTVNGMLPWQIQGYNKLISNAEIDAGLVCWDTGSGKSAFMASAIKHHEDVDFVLICVKSHNKIDTQRKLKVLGDIESVIGDGTKAHRLKIYQTLPEKVLIVNYEKVREDFEDLIPLIEGNRVLVFLDEAPTKLSNRKTKLYKAFKQLLYNKKEPRAAWMRSWALTATPIENSPNDVYSVCSIMHPGILGTQQAFYNDYVSSFNYFNHEPEVWKNLDRLEAKLQYMTHRVSKDDPDVARMFPEVLSVSTTIDWNPAHRHLYDQLTGKAESILKDEMSEANILTIIQVMQMICDAPSMVRASAQNRQRFYEMLGTDSMEEHVGSEVALMLVENLGEQAFSDKGHAKLETCREIILEKHPGEKVVIHSTWADYIFPVWEEWFDKWGITYVEYRGNTKEKQHVLDTFRQTDDFQCFLSGDAGADSIDISEASVGINYNIPWKWTTLKQREGRRDRVNSVYDTIYTYTLTMPNSVDERKLEICDRKFQYHDQLFNGKAVDELLSAHISREDLMYIIFG